MLGAEDPLAHRQQRGELVAGPGRVPRLPGVVGEVGAGGQGFRVLGARDPLAHRQQRGVLVAGPGRIPRLPGPVGEVGAGGQGFRVLGAETRSSTASSAAYWSRAPAASPACPVQWARSARAIRVSGCSAPDTLHPCLKQALLQRSRAAA